MTKKPWLSRTIVFNTLTVLVFLAGLFGYQPNDVLMHNLTTIMTNPMFVAAVNFGLRLVTKKPLALTTTDNGVTIDQLP